MDVRTLALINIVFLFAYALIMFINAAMNRDVRGGRWFALSNVAQGTAMLLITFGSSLPRAPATTVADILLTVGVMLLHRSFAEVLGRGRTAWSLHLACATLVCLGAGSFTFGGNYTAALILVSFVLSVQLTLTSALLFSSLRFGIKIALWFTAIILLASAEVRMMNAVEIYSYGREGAMTVFPTIMAFLLVGRLLANGGTVFGFMFLSSALVRSDLTRQADRDALTGLLNRRGMKTFADKALTRSHRAGEPVSTVMIDLDGMKLANDTWGHECGDELLRAVAKLLSRSVAGYGAVARLGGDEFLVVLPGMAMGGALEVAERLRSEIEMLNVPRCQPRASFGVASLNGLLWEEAVRQSDIALCQAKSAGRNRVMRFA